MNNRLHQLFRQTKTNILSIYFTAGFPMLNDTVSILHSLEQAKVDMVEIGFPFSDPLADGPTIQASSHKALQNGMSVSVLFKQLENVRSSCNIPIVLMGYLNPVLQYGELEFLQQCAKLGIDGLIIPDLPLEYYKKNWQPTCNSLGLSFIPLITPDTSVHRIKEIDQLADAFIYMVSSHSITGGNNDLSLQQAYFSKIKTMNLTHQTLIGFGIKDSESFTIASKYSSGAIVGSAFIKHLEANGTGQDNIKEFVQQIKHE